MGKRTMRQLFLWLLTVAVVFGSFSGSALGASTRFALVTDVVGTVKVTKAGGTKEVRAFNGMGLNEGDKVRVEKGSSLKLKIADREDEITLGDNWNGVLSKLKDNADGGKDTALKAWSGSMYTSVQKLTGSSDTYKVETPTAVMGVRGTHLTLFVDPITGIPQLFVNAGRVQVLPNDSNARTPLNLGDRSSPSVLALPSQMVTVLPGGGTSAAPSIVSVGVIDMKELVKNVSPKVIENVLTNKESIDLENKETIGDEFVLPEYAEGSILDLTEDERLEEYRRNVDNQLFGLLRQGLESGTISESAAKEIIESANQVISDTSREYDLNRPVQPLDPNAGVIPGMVDTLKELQQQTQQGAQQRTQTKEQLKEEYTTNNSSVISSVMQSMQTLIQQNEQAQTQKSDEAKQQYLASLTEQQKQQFQQRVEQIQQQVKSQEERRTATTPTTPTTSTGSGGSDGGTTTPASTTTSVIPSKTSAKAGEEITFTATVRTTGSVTVGTGNVVFKVNGVDNAPVAITNGSAVLKRSDLPEGETKVTATYQGTSAYATSTSTAVSVQVTGVPKVTAAKANDTNGGFDVQLKLDNFAGDDAVYGVEMHIVYDTNLKVKAAEKYFNSLKFDDSKVADSATQHAGTIGGAPKYETIYALLPVPGTGATAISFDGGELLATIPFERNSSSQIDSSTLRFSSVQIMRQDGTVISLTESELSALNIAYSFAAQTTQ